MAQRNIETATQQLVLPNGADIVGVLHNNLISNLRLDGAGSTQLLSPWRTARLVVEEKALIPVVYYVIEEA